MSDEDMEFGDDAEPSQPAPIIRKPRIHNRAPSHVNGQPLTPNTPAATAHPLEDESAEAHVLAACFLDDGPTLDRAQQSLSPDSFAFPQHAILFRQLSILRAEQKPLTPDVLLQERAQHLAGINPMLLVQLTDPNKYPTTAHAGYMIARVADLARRRQIQQAAKATLEGLERGADTPSLDLLFKRPEGAPQPAAAPKPTRVRHSSPPPEPQTRLFLAGKPISTPGNLTTIISRAKTGKTATLGAAVAAIIAAHNDRHDLDTLGFTAPHTDEAVILIDTEQSPYDAWVCHDRAIKRANSPDPEWLHHHAMVGHTPKQLREGLSKIITEATAAHKGIFTIILDGVADFVSSVNDEAETKEFIAWLRTITVTHNCPCICVIHSNEGVKTGDDGRGHLGKELTRKAESNLLLKKSGDVTTITSEKQRKAPITEADNISFRWSDEHQRHMSCESPADPAKKSGGRKKLHTIEEFWDTLPKPGARPMSAGQIHRFANDLKTVKLQTFKDLLSDAVTEGKLVRSFQEGAGYLYVRSV